MSTAPTTRPPPRRAAPTQQTTETTEARTGSTEIRKAGLSTGPPRIILNAVEGFGKTTVGAYMPKPIFMQAKGETGLDTLRQHERVPDVDTFDVIESWPSALDAVDYLIANDTGYKSLVLDALGGFERLCHQFVCDTEFRSDWGEKGFGAFQKGYDISVHEWLKLLTRLDQLRNARQTIILLTSHSMVRPFKNPAGPDFDRYAADCHPKTWGVSHKWADAILFGKFFTVVDGGKTGERPQKGKGIGGHDRVIYTEHCDAWDGKNRYGMPSEFDMPNDRTQSWTVIQNALEGVQ